MAQRDNRVSGSESKDEAIASLEQSLHEWRHILLLADRWLRWDNQNQPIIMAAIVTAFFLLLWWLEPSVLTAFSLIAMFACLLDYMGPSVFHSYLCRAAEWTSEHQRQYQQVCISLLQTKDSVVDLYQYLKTMRENKPKQYFVLMIAVLSVVAFLGNLIPNLCLAYLLALFLMLLPGLQQRGLLAQAYASSLQVLVDLIKQTKKKD